MLNGTQVTLALATLLAGAPAVAQERVTALIQGGLEPPIVVDVELEAGGVTDLVETDLGALTPIALPRVLGVARIDGRLWLTTDDGIVRYDEIGGPARYAYVDQILTGARYARAFPAGAGALAVRVDVSSAMITVEELDPTGTVLQSFAVTEIYRSIVEVPTGYLATDGDRIERLDPSFQSLGEFAPGAAQAANAAGLGYSPDRLTVLSDGRVAIAATVSIVITDASGNVEGVADPGLFESGAFETGGGLLAVPTLGGTVLLDPDTLEAFEVGGALSVALGFELSDAGVSSLPASSARGCVAAPNSVGPGARVHLLGVDDAAERTLGAIATGMPGGTFALPVFGTAAFNGPYGDGRLCVSPFSPGVTRGVVVPASALGSARTTFDFLSPQGGSAFLPGTTWHFQFVYRDGGGAAGFNGTDGVSISFRP